MKISDLLQKSLSRIILPARNARGMFLLFIALGIIVILGMAALAIDYGYWALTRSRLHAACDAAALAGARALSGPDDTTATANARAAAIAVARQNQADNRELTLVDGDVEVGNWNSAAPAPTPQFDPDPDDAPLNAVRVQAIFGTGSANSNPPVDTFFAKIFGMNSTTVGAKCTAAKIPPPILPIAANEYWHEPDSTCSTREYPNQGYPNSFLRVTNISGVGGCRSGLLSTLYGMVYAIAGSDAKGNLVPNNDRGWIDIFQRTGYYTPTSLEGPYHTADANGVIGNPSPGWSLTELVITQGGYHGLPPYFVDELFLSPYPGLVDSPQYNNVRLCANPPTYPNPPPPPGEPPTAPCTNFISQSPYATVPYIGGAHAEVIGAMASDPRYQPGQNVIVFAYDGIARDTGQGRKTFVGAALVKICGYGNPGSNPSSFASCSGTSSGNTLYAKAVVPLTTDFSALLNEVSQVHLVE